MADDGGGAAGWAGACGWAVTDGAENAENAAGRGAADAPSEVASATYVATSGVNSIMQSSTFSDIALVQQVVDVEACETW
jgi:hypothetical protein